MLNLTEGQHFDHKYELVRLIDSGGFAEVWEAKYLIAGNIVALKIYPRLDEEGAATIEAEYKRLFELRHSNLVNALHFGRFRHYPYLVMHYYPGGNGSRRIGSCDEAEIALILTQIGGCLKYLHANDIVHQDIKPNNFLLDQKGNYYLADLGLSLKVRTTIQLRTMRDPSAGDTGQRRAAVTGITPPPYRAPELASPHSIDRMPIKATDVWAFGASLYEMITGFPPFGDLGGLLQKQGSMPSPLPDPISGQLNGLLLQCLSEEPPNRPTAAQLEKWGLQYLDGAPSQELPARLDPARPPASAQTIRPSQLREPAPPPPLPPQRIDAKPATGSNPRLILILGAVAAILALLVVVVLNGHTTFQDQNQVSNPSDTLTQSAPDTSASAGTAPGQNVTDTTHFVNDNTKAGDTTAERDTPDISQDPSLNSVGNLDLTYPTVDFPPTMRCPPRISRLIRTSNSMIVYLDFAPCPGQTISLYGPGDDHALYATNAAHTQVYSLTYLSISGEHIQIPSDGLRVVATFQRPGDDVDVLDIIGGTNRSGAPDIYFDFKGIHL